VYPDLIVTSRKVNDGMPNFVMQELIKLLGHHNLPIKKATIGIFGLSYKENVKDARNSLALKLIKFLTQYGFHLQLHDPILDPKTMYKKYGHELLAFEEIQNLALAVVVVGHDFYRKVGLHSILAKLSQPKILMDIPNLYIDEIAESSKKKSVTYWNL
jgi:UDP-N-acetyl-D-galactosamine dehydrogenase